MSSSRSSYCSPAEVVATKDADVGWYPYTRLTFQLALWLFEFDRSETPGRLLDCSNCSSGGNSSAFCCENRSIPPAPMSWTWCWSRLRTSNVAFTLPTKRLTSSSLGFTSAAVCSGLVPATGLFGYTPFTGRTSRKLGVNGSAM